MSLRCGERLVRCLAGEPVDRVPFGVGLGWQPWSQTRQRWMREAGVAQLDLHRHFGFDNGFALPQIEYGIYPPFERQVLQEEDTTSVIRDEHGVIKRISKTGPSVPQTLEHPVKDDNNWDQLVATKLQPGCEGRIKQDWDVFRERLHMTGEAVQVGKYPNGVFGTARDLLGVESLLTGFYDNPALIHAIMGHCTSLWISIWEQVAEEVQIDHIHIWEDMSGRQGSLISPNMVREFMMPCYDRIVAFAKHAGVRLVSVDTDGDCSELTPIFLEHGINMIFPFEVQAGNNILEYRELYPELGIMGGLDKRALALGKSAIDIEVDKARDMITKGRYVPCFDHHIPPDVSWSNFLYATNQLKKACYRLN